MSKKINHDSSGHSKKSDNVVEDSSYFSDISAHVSEFTDTDKYVWFVNLGASMHMTFRKDFFVSLQPLQGDHFVIIANKILPAVGLETVIICETFGSSAYIYTPKKCKKFDRRIR